MKVKILSDGTTYRTKVLTEDGKLIEGIQRLYIIADAYEGLVTALLVFHNGKKENVSGLKIDAEINEENVKKRELK